MTYLLPSEQGRVQVQVDGDGLPTGFVWQRRFHRVRVINTWRVHDSWWSQPLWRDYFAVTTDCGWRAVLFHELHEQVWYLERLQD